MKLSKKTSRKKNGVTRQNLFYELMKKTALIIRIDASSSTTSVFKKKKKCRLFPLCCSFLMCKKPFKAVYSTLKIKVLKKTKNETENKIAILSKKWKYFPLFFFRKLSSFFLFKTYKYRLACSISHFSTLSSYFLGLHLSFLSPGGVGVLPKMNKKTN